MTEPIELTQIRQQLADARQAFAQDVDALLDELRVFSDSLVGAIGDVSRDEALRGLRRFVLERFDQRLPIGARVDPVGLQQLVREAFDLLTNPESAIDLRDWVRAAAPVVGPPTS